MQEIIVILIGITVFGYAAYRLRQAFTHKSPDDTSCGGGCGGNCASGDPSSHTHN